MIALSVAPPWTFWLGMNMKDVENRTRRLYVDGPLALHSCLTIDRAAVSPTEEARIAFEEAGDWDGLWWPRQPGSSGPPLLACGAIVAVARLAGCHTCDGSCSVWALPGKVHLEIADVQPLTRAIPVRGQQWPWPVPPHIQAEIREQLTLGAA